MENSKKLLNHAIDILQEGNVAAKRWSIGGGTILANSYYHRLSKDIDIFLDDVQILSVLSPRFNNKSEDALDYDEMSQYISLTFPEGKVDFIASPQITKFPAQKQQFLGHEVLLDDPVEIVSKKLYFRGGQVLPRDVFDLAVLFASNRRQDLLSAALAMPDKVNQFVNAFSKQMQNPDFKPYSVTYADMLLHGGKPFQNKEFQVCKEFVQCIQAALNKEQTHKQKLQVEMAAKKHSMES
jgi:hypothetical protein